MGAFFVFRQHDVVAVCPKGGKDATNKGKQATKFGRINQLPSRYRLEIKSWRNYYEQRK